MNTFTQNNMTWNIEHISKAWQLATAHHDGQKYGGAHEGERIEYLNHIGSVVLEVMNALQYEKGLDANLALLCAILHDTVEDTTLRKEDIEVEFGGAVAAGVAALSKDETLPTKEAQMRDSLDRIIERPREVAMVKLADRICNLSAPPYYWDDAKKIKYKEEAQTILAALAYASSYLAKRLAAKIKDYEQFIGG